MAYIPHTKDEIKEMLSAVGAESIEELFCSIPKELRFGQKLNLPDGISEQELSNQMTALAMKNRTLSCSASFLGAGCYRHYVPAAVSELASRSEFVTPYTPYQPEISQGTLQVLFEYQSLICRLFEMDVSNASHYSGATACADAALMARRIGKGRRKVIVIDSVHPEYRAVIKSYLCGYDDLVTVPSKNGVIDLDALKKVLDDKTAAVIAQFPNFFGIVEDLKNVVDETHKAGALFIEVVPEPISLGILKTPGSFGADIAVGEGISLGLPTNFGGPTLGIFTVKNDLVRQMPGRVCGKTQDSNGKTGYVLTLATREQHIRREKATSNICSNQALCATQSAIFMTLLGKAGMQELGELNAAKAAYALQKLTSVSGVRQKFNSPVFNEFVIETDKPAAEVLNILADKGIFGGVDLAKWYPELNKCILVCATEMNTKEEIDRYAEVIGCHCE